MMFDKKHEKRMVVDEDGKKYQITGFRRGLF